MIYDYIIRLPETPAFEDNIEAMLSLIIDDGGTSPTIKRNRDANGNITSHSFSSQKGTVPSTGVQLIHFRLPARYTESELITYLNSPMSPPIPSLRVMLIRSRDLIINIGTEEEPEWIQEELVAINKANILQFFEVHTFDEDGNITNTRSANMGDTLSFSHYQGTPIITV